MKKYKKKLGQFGEDLAVSYYQKRGYEVLERNWEKKLGEIDLIVTKDSDLVFIEVKTRTTPYFGYGENAVSYTKKQKINKTISQYKRENQKYDEYFPRFDILVVEIFSLIPKFEWFENVEL